MHRDTHYPRHMQRAKLATLALVCALLIGAILPTAVLAGDPGGIAVKVFKFNDANFNEVQDAGEEPLASWQFSLFTPDGNMLQAVTGADGFARFLDVPALMGEYRVTETPQLGWTNTTPLTRTRQRTENDPWLVWTIAYGNAQTSVIKVIKFHDLDGDGVLDEATETGLAGIEFILTQLDGESWVEVGRGFTGVLGRLAFTGLPPGTYRVQEILTGDYLNTTPLVQEIILGNNDRQVVYFGNKVLPRDFGDLPEAYGLTTLSENGARHLPGNLWLGSIVDQELDGQPSLDARQDDNDGLTDEDGVHGVFTAPEYWNAGQGTIQVTISGEAGCFNAWLDVWNSAANGVGLDNDFSDSGEGWNEHALVNQYLEAGVHTLNFPLPLRQSSPDIFARFRLSPAVNGSCAVYEGEDLLYGLQESGEVEDMQFRFGPTAVELSGFSAESSMNNPMIVLGLIWLVGLGLLVLALDMREHNQH